MLTNNAKIVYPRSKKLRLIQYLMQEGIRVFRRAELEGQAAKDLELNYQSFGVMLHTLCREGWISQIRRGIYIVENLATPIYEQEIAMALVGPAMISHGSAFRYHDLTDQPASKIQITTINSVFAPQGGGSDKKSTITICGVVYEFIRINKEKFFGEQIGWRGAGKFKVTDLERTLLDGLSHPQHCGGLQEVIYAFRENFDRVDLEQIISYAMRLDITTSRRLGWVLDNLLEVGMDKISCLAQKNSPGYRLLDPTRSHVGPYDPKWKIQLNHHV